MHPGFRVFRQTGRAACAVSRRRSITAGTDRKGDMILPGRNEGLHADVFFLKKICMATLNGICEGDPLSPPKGEAAQGG